ncbi:pentapeptide repeat-containing protein [Leptolyngbya sp. Cla-17]|uniref:pentapeptide repeat-containing protein n=1 Tax=Leptolyngbya sp. Cla-17 TaxID=2803751 RepID=UPI001F5DA6D7|nr:pentapeptide repeat-containing protein [Leptolyngbya sp. Cla-17]
MKTIRNATGTTFSQADLDYANFSHAIVFKTDFSGKTTLDWVNWTGVKFFRCSFPRNFEDASVISLCTDRDGRGQDYRNGSLTNLDLRGVNLTDVVLASANLNGANLHHANLVNADLSNAQVLRTNFSEANLTGACIQNWGINSDTQFTNVRCDYIYLETAQRERKPASGSFQPGDFERLAHQFTKTLDFLFRNGIQPEAFDVALRDLLEKHGSAGLTFDSLQNFENGAQLLRINVANPDADKTPMHRQFTNIYAPLEKQLAAKQEKINILEQEKSHLEGKLAVYSEQVPSMWRFLFNQTEQFSRPTLHAPNSHFSGDPMADKGNKVEIGSIGGDASGISGGDNSGVAGKNITGAAGRDISGTLEIALDQLSDSQDPQALKLAELLKQVKTAIEKSDSGLSEADQQKALKHLETIGKLGADPKNPDLLEKAGDALDALPTIIQRSNTLAEFAERYLPTFTAGVKAIFSVWGVAL